MGQRPERCAVGQTWLSLLALRSTACPFKLLSIWRRRPRDTAIIAARATLPVVEDDGDAAGATGERRALVEGTDIVLYRDFLFEFRCAVAERSGGAKHELLGGERPVCLHVEDERV